MRFNLLKVGHGSVKGHGMIEGFDILLHGTKWISRYSFQLWKVITWDFPSYSRDYIPRVHKGYHFVASKLIVCIS